MTYAIIGLVFVLVVVFAILASKTWHWVNIVFLVLSFVAGTAACAGLAKSLKLRRAATKDLKTSEDRAIAAMEQARRAVNGSPDSPGYDIDSLRGRNDALEQELMGRGRVWASGQVTANNDNRVFKFSAARDEADLQTVPLKDIFLYAFEDGIYEGQTYPQTYIGSFRVISETPEQVELEPIFVANGTIYSESTSSWSLFEKMPLDRRDVFKKANAIDETAELDISAYRELLMTNYFQPERLGYDLTQQEDAAAYELLIDQHTFDGLELGKIQNWIDAQQNRVRNSFEPAPEEVFVEYKFDKKTQEVFEVDATGNISTDGYFTQLGLAADPSLHAGKKIAFAKDDTVIVDLLSAEGYQRGEQDRVPPFSSQYTVSEVRRFYQRQLKDYPYLLSDLGRQAAELGDETVRVQEQNVVQNETLANASDQVEFRTNLQTDLNSDLAGFQRDSQVINDKLKQLEERLAEELAAIRMLEKQLENNYREIRRRSDTSPTSTR